MGTWTAVAGSERHRFDGLPQLLAAASPRRSGDEPAGVTAGSEASAWRRGWRLRRRRPLRAPGEMLLLRGFVFSHEATVLHGSAVRTD